MMLVCMDVIIGLSHWLKNTRWRHSKTRCWQKWFGTKAKAVTIVSRNLRRNKLHELHSSAYIFMMIESKCIGWWVYVARVGQTTDPYEASCEVLKELHCLEDRRVYERKILKLDMKIQYDIVCKLDLSDSKKGIVSRSCEQKPSGSINEENFWTI
jgi:hypothetical protein